MSDSISVYNCRTEAVELLLNNGFVEDNEGDLILESEAIYLQDTNEYVHHDNEYCSCDQCGEHNSQSEIITEDYSEFCCTDCCEESGYYQHEDGCWYDYPEKVNGLYEYHSEDRQIEDTTQDNPYLIGFEIEKEDKTQIERFENNDISLPDGWIPETDSSLDSEQGFELVSPAYNLSNDQRILGDFKQIEELLNADSSTNCGGHITISKLNTTGSELADKIKGLFPLLLCLYPKRLKSSYSIFKTHNDSKTQYDRYNAFRIEDNRIELRIISRVTSLRCLEWRYELIKFMLENEMTIARTKRSLEYGWLYYQLRKVYSTEEVANRIELFNSFVDAFYHGVNDEAITSYMPVLS